MIRRLLIGVALASCPASVLAQDSPALVEYYGEGVHAYSSGDIFEAHRMLTEAIEGGIQDPRAYYFRAMTLLRMGREPEAEADMIAGAHLEVRAPSGAYSVDRSIQRLQGSARLRLEKVRRQVRFEAEQQQRSDAAQRYEETQRREAEVLRTEPRPTYDEAVQQAAGSSQPSAGAAVPPPPAADTIPPAAGGPGAEVPPAGVTPQPPTETPTPPAGDPVPPATPPAEAPPNETDPFATEDDPFASQPQPAGDAAASQPTAATDAAVEVGQKVEGTRLLGILAGIVGDVVEDALPQPGQMPPFGPGAGAPAITPFGGPAGQDDPFGGAADPFGQPPAQVQPPAQDEDPFGGQDPFGPGEVPGGEDAQSAPGTDQNDDPFGGEPAAPANPSDPFGAGESEVPSNSSDAAGAADDPFN